MNKKGNIITYLPFKKYLIFCLIMFMILCISFFLILKGAGIISFSKKCPEGIIPERIPLWDMGDGRFHCMSPINQFTGIPSIRCNNTWNDGTKMWILSCSKGKYKNENINYVYCKNIKYSKQPITTDGTIKKEILLKIDLIIDPKDETEEGYKIINSKCAF